MIDRVTEHSQKRSAGLLRIHNTRKGVAPSSKKTGHPLPPTSRSAKKGIGLINLRTGRGDPFAPHVQNMVKERTGTRCTIPNTKNTVRTNLSFMSDAILVEIVGLKSSECSPFPCDGNRTCGLSACYPSGKLDRAFEALKARINEIYGNRVEVKLTLIDEMVPEHIRAILEKEYPPIPMVLVNGKLTRIGRIVADRIISEIETCL